MIGEKIKKKRIDLNLTQQGLAESVGVTKSYISQIEKTKIIPSISKLRNIAKSLNVDVAYLVKSDDFDKNNNVEPVLRKSGGYDIIKFHGGKEEWIILPPGVRNGKVVSIIGVLKPNLVENTPIALKGHKLVYVIEGTIDFIYNDKTISISKGDTLFIDSSFPHGWVNPYNYPAKALVVLLD